MCGLPVNDTTGREEYTEYFIARKRYSTLLNSRRDATLHSRGRKGTPTSVQNDELKLPYISDLTVSLVTCY